MAETDFPVYEVLAFRFGSHEGRLARENFLHSAHLERPDEIAPYAFYIWVVRNEDALFVVDTGFSAHAAARRGRLLLRPPVEALADLGIAAPDVADLVITHLHYDHAGNLGAFTGARVHVQEAEMRFCVGHAMRHEAVRRPFEAEDVNEAVRLLFGGRLVPHRGPVTLAPGVELHPVPGHTPGSQAVRVHTRRGWVVLAGDAAHLWANIRGRSPFPILDDLTAMLDGFTTLEALADGPDHVVPGHEPLVAQRFPRAECAPEWISLHEQPAAAGEDR